MKRATFLGAAIAVACGLAARGESPAAFGRRCIPPGCVVPRSNTPGILTRRALPAGRIASLGATPDFHHGLAATLVAQRSEQQGQKPQQKTALDLVEVVGCLAEAPDQAWILDNA